MRRAIVAGNWKMNSDAQSAPRLADAVVRELGRLPESVEVVVCPPFPLIPIVEERIRNSSISLGAQTVHHKEKGAFTGEVSAPMLRSLGCAYVIVGHSERRLMFAESDLDVSLRANAVASAGMRPIICVGETEAEREDGRTESIVERQVRQAIDGFFDFNIGQCVIAYEPIWAIGTDNAATPDQIQHVHAFIRGLIGSIHGEAGRAVPVIYGGSLKPEITGPIFACPDVDGGLVGGASIEAGAFAAIVKAAVTQHG